MNKNTKMNNSLIKRKNLLSILKNAGITRTSPKALEKLEKTITTQAEQTALNLKEKITIQGKKTLEMNDID